MTMPYERIPLQARLNTAEDKAFTEAARRHDMTRAALCRWLVTTYLADNALGRKLRVASGRQAEAAQKPAKAKPARKATSTPKRTVSTTTGRSRKPKVSVTSGRCKHGNLGLCLQCAQDRAAAEI
jgi:hypothetical protein